MTDPSDTNYVGARAEHARALFQGIAPQYEWMGAVWSFGQDARWRRALVSRLELAPGSRVLDVASGTGLVARCLMRHEYDVTQLDPSEEMLRAGRRAATGAVGAERMRAIRGRAESLPFPDAVFDGLSFTYLLRYVDDPAETLRELARVLRPGGRIVSLEFHVPEVEWARSAWRVYTRRLMPIVGAAVSPSWKSTGRFLGPSIEAFYDAHPVARQLAWWRDAGLEDVRATTMSNAAAIVTQGVKT